MNELKFIRDEIQIVKTVSHPNIIEFKEVFESEDEIHIVMEQMVDGELS